MVKSILTAFLVLTSLSAKAKDEVFYNKVADAIYVAEGGSLTRYPYGVKSLPGRLRSPRQVCINSVRNNYRRWEEAGKPGDFLEFMGRRYCPPNAHPLNRNWVRNVRYHLNKN